MCVYVVSMLTVVVPAALLLGGAGVHRLALVLTPVETGPALCRVVGLTSRRCHSDGAGDRRAS